MSQTNKPKEPDCSYTRQPPKTKPKTIKPWGESVSSFRLRNITNISLERR